MTRSIHSSQPIPEVPVWTKAATYASASALAVSLITMAVVLGAYPHMSIVNFSLLSSGVGLSFVSFALSYYLLHRKENKRIQALQHKISRKNFPSQVNFRESHVSSTHPSLSDPPSRPPSEFEPPPEEEEESPLQSEEAVSSETLPEINEERDEETEEVQENENVFECVATQESLIEESCNEGQVEESMESILDEEQTVENVETNVEEFTQEEPIPPQQLMPVESLAPPSEEQTLESEDPFEAFIGSADNFLQTFYSAYQASCGKTLSENEKATLKNSLDDLKTLIMDISQDSLQLVRFSFPSLIDSEKAAVKFVPIILQHNQPADFIHSMATIFPPSDSSEKEEKTVLRSLLSKIATKTTASNALNSLYQDLRKKANAYQKERNEEKRSNKYGEYYKSLILFTDTLFKNCQFNQTEIDEIISGKNSLPKDILGRFIGSHILFAFQSATEAFKPNGMLSKRLFRMTLSGVLANNGFGIKKSIDLYFSKLPLKSEYIERLTPCIKSLVTILAPALKDALLGNSTLSRTVRSIFTGEEETFISYLPPIQDWNTMCAIIHTIFLHYDKFFQPNP